MRSAVFPSTDRRVRSAELAHTVFHAALPSVSRRSRQPTAFMFTLGRPHIPETDLSVSVLAARRGSRPLTDVPPSARCLRIRGSAAGRANSCAAKPGQPKNAMPMTSARRLACR
ncbi:hypothetical protein AAFF_G00434950 [Aldrovandia affinis]|uniref:Uncharacterized protein n=1 Tax=Aldrovandia affinis TaxID=143900 RepID=A0AAD7SAJ8_9TELE|nr:hypothetical protein AAFF_G00434950 [Aldrovandia affinis]